MHDLRYLPDDELARIRGYSVIDDMQLRAEKRRREAGGAVLTPDLRTADQKERDDVTALRLEVQRLADVIDVLARRIGRLEGQP